MGQYPVELPETAEGKELVFVYVHGFGEYGLETSFEEKMREFLEPVKDRTDVFTYRWERVLINPLKVIDQWQNSKARADSVAPHLLNNIVLKLEELEVPYVIIGYSLGSRVVSKALSLADRELKYLKGIYFMGSAMPNDFRPDISKLPPGMKIINYYSKFFDTVLKMSYSYAEKNEAGGEVGFSDSAFVNYRTVCTHVHKGGPVQRDYTELAEPIGYLSLMKEGIFYKESYIGHNMEMPVLNGGIQWNDIVIYDHPRKILIQQNMTTGHYRAVEITADGGRTRVAWGNSLHAILDGLGMFGEKKLTVIVP
ncbi:MAG TPA: DUF726 domain-containing protein [Clostridiales bacterium]|nr:DUF726 domain-containing protein [Clostridiales bacterium]